MRDTTKGRTPGVFGFPVVDQVTEVHKGIEQTFLLSNMDRKFPASACYSNRSDVP